MRPDRVIKLPVFRTMVRPVARKDWKCNICKERVTIGERYTHYIDRRAHEIINYRFHNECFGIVEAYCTERKRTSFTPQTVRKWALKTFCESCKEDCPLHACTMVNEGVKKILRNVKKPLDISV